MGLCRAAAGDFRQAVWRLELAYSLNWHDVMSAYELVCMARAASLETRIPPLRLEAQTGRSNPEAIRRLADIVTGEHDYVSAMLCLPASRADAEVFGLMSDVLSAAMETHNGFADLHHGKSQVLARLGRMDEAILHATRALAINPKYVQARIHLGRLLAGRDPASAIGHLEQAAADGGNYADVHVSIARLYEQTGRPERARGALRKALEINGNYTQAKDALARLAA